MIDAQRVVGAFPDGPLSILDIGAGTGRVAATAWRQVSECFNPASLITERGRSVLRQLLKVAAAVIIEDPDLRRNDLVAHARHFGLADAAIIHCAGDRVRTEVEHFAVVRRPLADRLPGTRIW